MWKKAFNYYESAAIGGDSEALFRLGTAYMTPLLQLQKDMQKALYYFEQAALEEHVDAIYNLGFFYENGIGVERNASLAINYYEHAAELEDVSAIQALIRIYSEGSIVMKDEVSAQRWKRILTAFDSCDE